MGGGEKHTEEENRGGEGETGDETGERGRTACEGGEKGQGRGEK